jgi:hypothetical protein
MAVSVGVDRVLDLDSLVVVDLPVWTTSRVNVIDNVKNGPGGRALACLAILVVAIAGCATPGGDPVPAQASGSATPQPPTGARGSSAGWLDALTSTDRAEIDRTVTAIAALPPHGVDPDVLLAAARACEDKLLDPARAVALYDRIVAEHTTARAAVAAVRRAQVLREQIGPRGERAALAAELSQLVASSDEQPAEAVIERGDRLAAHAWPGAPTAALWLADWLRRSGRFDAAQARYAQVIARWPDTPSARTALRGAAGCALDAHQWSLAEALAGRLPAANPSERALRDDLLAAAARGRLRDRWYVIAWLAALGAFLGLLGSAIEAALRSPSSSRWSVLRPPLEAVFLAPVALVLIGVAFTAHRLIAPAVATITLGGLALTWLSGATLDQLRARGRAHRLRSIAHAIACLVVVAALGYISLHRDQLLDLLVETVRFGPEG